MPEALADIGVFGFEDRTQRIRDRLNERGLLPETRMPRYRYWQKGNGPMFCYTTERVDTVEDKFEFVSFVYRPVGPGARSGKAERWEVVERLWGRHSKRKAAKARALRLFKRWQETGRI